MESKTSLRSASALRATLPHPVIDADGHHLEFLPKLDEYLREGMGHGLFEEWLEREKAVSAPLPIRREKRIGQPGWWTASPATLPEDRAAAALPRLLRQKMDQIGIDYMVLYTSVGLRGLNDPNPEVRQGFCWCLNEFYADNYLEFRDRLTPAGVIPMYTPEEALRELQHCHDLGLKVVHLPHGVPRPVRYGEQKNSDPHTALHWLDTYGMDSAFDYATVWQRLIDLGFAGTFHGHSSHATSVKTSRSVTNYVFNHIGAHAGLMFELCKSLILGGVTRRFEGLQLAFLEGGVHWATGFLNDFIEHWEKRNAIAVKEYDPRRLDTKTMRQLFQQWGGKLLQGCSEEDLDRVYANRREGPGGDSAEPVSYDDFALCSIAVSSDIPKLFGNLYFGCEADDSTVHLAYDPCDEFRTKLRAMFSSDFGHWDAGDSGQLLPSSYGLVERGLLSPEDFRAFTADNVIRLHGRMNSSFWKGTAVEQYAMNAMRASPASDKAE